MRWESENFENIKNYPWDMLTNFCFQVYAQKSLFIGENDNEVCFTSSFPCEFRVHTAGSRLKIIGELSAVKNV